MDRFNDNFLDHVIDNTVDSSAQRQETPLYRKHAERLKAIQGISIPHNVRAALGDPVPGLSVRAWSWWSAVWDRPDSATWDQNPAFLMDAQDEWDDSSRFVSGQRELAKERESRVAEQEAAREAERQQESSLELEEVTERLRRSYMAQPGATESQCEADLPEMLRQHARDAAISSEHGASSPLTIDDILNVGVS